MPLKTDRYTKDRTMLEYARLLIDVSLDSPFPDFIEFFNDHDVLIRQQVVYEWKPVKCSYCQCLAMKSKFAGKKEGQGKNGGKFSNPQQIQHLFRHSKYNKFLIYLAIHIYKLIMMDLP